MREKWNQSEKYVEKKDTYFGLDENLFSYADTCFN